MQRKPSQPQKQKKTLIGCENCKKFQPKCRWRQKTIFFNFFFYLVFFPKFKKTNKCLIDNYHESKFSHPSDQIEAFLISRCWISLKKQWCTCRMEGCYMPLICNFSQCSFFKSSICIIHEKKLVRLKGLFCLITYPRKKTESLANFLNFINTPGSWKYAKKGINGETLKQEISTYINDRITKLTKTKHFGF